MIQNDVTITLEVDKVNYLKGADIMLLEHCNIEKVKRDILVTALINDKNSSEEIICLIFKDDDIVFKCIDNGGKILALKFKDKTDGIEYICQSVPNFKKKYSA